MTWLTVDVDDWVSNGCNPNEASKVEFMIILVRQQFVAPNPLHDAGLFKHFVNLRCLSLHLCDLPTIPEGVWELSELKELSVSCNSGNKSEISPKIKNLTKLVHLQFSNCVNLTTIPDDVWELSELQSLYFNNNNIYKISPKIKNLTKLIDFQCRNNQLTTFPTEIYQLPNLIHLDCRGNPFDLLNPDVLDFIASKGSKWFFKQFILELEW